MLTKCENVLGLKHRNDTRDWITEETWEEINTCKITKQKIKNADEKIRPNLMAEYSEINKYVKRYAIRDNRAWTDKLPHKSPLAAEAYKLKELYKITKRFCREADYVPTSRCQKPNWTFAHNSIRLTDQMQEYFKDNFAAPLQQICTYTTQRTPETTKISYWSSHHERNKNSN